MIEKAQHFAFKVCLKDWSLNYEEALDLAHIPPLIARRDRAALCYMYNIVHNNMDFENAPIEPRPISLTRHSNSHQLRQPYCHTNAFQNSFFLRLSQSGTHYLKKCLLVHRLPVLSIFHNLCFIIITICYPFVL